jgi:hypothetical protein
VDVFDLECGCRHSIHNLSAGLMFAWFNRPASFERGSLNLTSACYGWVGNKDAGHIYP